MKRIDYFKKSNNYRALIVMIPPEVIQKQISKLRQKWVRCVVNLSIAKNKRKLNKWTNCANKIQARINQLEYPFSRVSSDYLDK